MMLGARTGAWSGKRGGIPADCVEVKYLESTGTQAVLIDYQIKFGDKVSIVFEPIDISNSYSIWSNRTYSSDVDDKSYTCFALTTGIRFDYRNKTSGTLAEGVRPPVGVKSTIEAIGNNLYYNGSVIVSAPLIPSYNVIGDLCLFASTGASKGLYTNFAKVRIYSFSCGSDLNLVPVRSTTDGLGYMCDTLTGKLYGNAGTGAFIIGPDKKPTARDYKGVMTLNLDGIENVGFGVHSAFADLWKDLSGNGNDFTLESKNFDENSLLLSDDKLGGYLRKTVRCDYYEAIIKIRSGGIGSNYGEVSPLYFGDHVALGVTTKSFGGLPSGYTYFTGQRAPRYFADFDEYTFDIGNTVRICFDLANESYRVGDVWRSCKNNSTVKVFDIGLSCIGGRKSASLDDGYINGNLYAVRCFEVRPSDVEIAHNYEIDKARFNLQ